MTTHTPQTTAQLTRYYLVNWALVAMLSVFFAFKDSLSNGVILLALGTLFVGSAAFVSWLVRRREAKQLAALNHWLNVEAPARKRRREVAEAIFRYAQTQPRQG